MIKVEIDAIDCNFIQYTGPGGFTVGQVLTDGITGATGTIIAVDIIGSSVTISNTVGVFSNTDTITDPLGGSGVIASIGSLFDTFKWYNNAFIMNSLITINSGGQNLADSNGNVCLGIDFGASTGHTLGDYWEFTMTPFVASAVTADR